jgi:hypothetical protein
MKSIENLYKIFKQKYDAQKDKYKKTPTATTINHMVTEIKKAGNILMTDFYKSKYPSDSA